MADALMDEQEMTEALESAGWVLEGTVTRMEGDRITIEQTNGEEVTLQVVRSPVPAHVREAVERFHAENGLWPCGCLANDGGAHRVGCPEHPEGVRGDRL